MPWYRRDSFFIWKRRWNSSTKISQQVIWSIPKNSLLVGGCVLLAARVSMKPELLRSLYETVSYKLPSNSGLWFTAKKWEFTSGSHRAITASFSGFNNLCCDDYRVYIPRISIFFWVPCIKIFFRLEQQFWKQFVLQSLSKMIHQQFEIPKNEHKVQIKLQLWLILGAHCNLFFGLP